MKRPSRKTAKQVAKVLVVLLLSVGALIPTSRCLCSYEEWWQYRAATLRMMKLLESIHSRKPYGSEAVAWEAAYACTQIACANVCFSPSHTSAQELALFTTDLEQISEKGVDAELFRWIWDRLGYTGRYGHEYVRRNRAQFDEVYKQLQITEDRAGHPPA